MSQIGTSFRKISLFDATCFDIDPWADSDDEAAFLYSAQDAGKQVEYLHLACTWFSRAQARWAPTKSWKGVLQT